MALNPYQQYRAAAIETADPVKLVVMLYQGMLRFTQQAIRAIERQEVAEAHRSFVRAQEIVAELRDTLDHEAGGEVAENLAGLYDYVYRKLVEANVKKATPPAMEAVQVFRELMSAWQAIAATPARGVAGPERVAALARSDR